MPRNRKTWASWNFLGHTKASDTAAVCVSYYVNRLQHLPPGWVRRSVGTLGMGLIVQARSLRPKLGIPSLPPMPP